MVRSLPGDSPARARRSPFRVYFGRRKEVYADRSCRGVLAQGGSLVGKVDSAEHAFKLQVLDLAKPDAILAREKEARKAHADIEKKARAADVWGEVNVAVQAAVAHPWFRQAPSPERWAAALAPFANEDVSARPFYIDPDLRCFTFQREGSRLEVLELQTDGSMDAEGTELRPEPAAPPEACAEGLHEVLRRLARRDVMAGQVFHLVEASRYRLIVERAARSRVAQVAADLAVRVQVLQALGVAESELAGEADRFYDAAFLDAPTIGVWL